MFSDNLIATAISLLDKYGSTGVLRNQPLVDPITGVESGIPFDMDVMYHPEDKLFPGIEGSLEPGQKKIIVSSSIKPNNNQLFIDKDLLVYGIIDITITSAQNKDIIYTLLIQRSQ